MKFRIKLLAAFLAIIMLILQLTSPLATTANNYEDDYWSDDYWFDEYSGEWLDGDDFFNEFHGEIEFEYHYEDVIFYEDNYFDNDETTYFDDWPELDPEYDHYDDWPEEDGYLDDDNGDINIDLGVILVDDDYLYDDDFYDLCPIVPLNFSADYDSYVPEMLFADDMLEYIPEPEECISIMPFSASPGSAGSGLVQFVLEPISSSLPNGVTMAQARTAAMNTDTVYHRLYPTATSNVLATAVNGRFGRDAIFLGQSNNRFRIMIAGFVGYVPITGRTVRITVPIDGTNRSFDVRANAVFVSFGSYPTASSGSVRSASHYVNRNGELWRYLTTNVNNTNFQRFLTGPAPSWMTQNRRYYSYDGVFFYTNPRNIRANGSGAVNANNPHFNYFQYLSFRSQSTVTAAQLNNFLVNHSGLNVSNSVMVNQGNAFINAQNRYGTNALLMYAKAMHESAGGTSAIARNNNNLFGQGAIDAAPGTNAWHFATPAASVNDLANGWLSRGYLWPGDWRYEGPHVGHKGSGMNVRYATDPYWGQKIAGWAFRIDRTRPANSRDINREQIVIRQNTSTVAVQNAAGSTLYTANPRGGRYFPFLVVGTSGNRLRIQTDPAIVNGATNQTALYNRNNAIGYIPNGHVWTAGASSPSAPGQSGSNNNITQPAITTPAQTAVTTPSGLNFRRGPGTNYAVIRTLSQGTNVVRLGTNANGSWSFIRVGNQEGWVSTTYLNLSHSNSNGFQVHTRLAVTTSNAAFRIGPGANYSSLRTVPVHTEVEITGRQGDWMRVRVGSDFGWIATGRLRYRTRIGITTLNATMRTGAGIDRPVVTVIPVNSEVTIIGVSHSGNWTRVRFGSYTGWIPSRRVANRDVSGRTTANASFRRGPGPDFSLIENINRNTNVTILGHSGNWTQVRIGNRTGWIASGRVTRN